MKPQTYLMLLNEIKTKKYRVLGDQSIANLFELYVNSEILTLDDLFRDHHAFIEFVRENIEYFELEEVSDKYVVSGIAYLDASSLMILNNRFMQSLRLGQESFVQAVEKVIDYNRKCKILEVGSGAIPYSSMLLGCDGMDISSMDKFKISDYNLSLFNVKSYKQLFDSTVDVSEYDLVVGRRPCSAIKPVVEKCSIQKVPYFLNLCVCDSPNGRISGWRHVLKMIDKDIHYMGDYAYNLNLGDKRFADNVQIDEIIKRLDRRYGEMFFSENNEGMI
jgi:hypothetical protein